MSRRARTTAALAALLCLVLHAAPAAAHESDPQVQSELASVQPSLPDEVVLQVQANIAPQLVADNPTDVELDVIDDEGQPFLRLSSRGVFANLESLDFYTTNNFAGSSAAAPRSVLARTAPAPPRWAQLSRGSSWGWFDHRLDVESPTIRDRSRPADLGIWEVPLEYGGRPVIVQGVTRFEPLRGTFEVTVDPAPDGSTAQALQGRLPGLFLTNTGGPPVTVLDQDGQPYVRLDPAGSVLNVNSRLHLEDLRARGETAAAVPPAGVSFEPLPSTSRTWLDSRLRYEDGVPPERALTSREPTVLGTWRIPVLVGARPSELTGQIRWVPRPADEFAARSGASDPAGRSGVLTAGLLVGGGALLLAVALLARRATRRRGA